MLSTKIRFPSHENYVISSQIFANVELLSKTDVMQLKTEWLKPNELQICFELSPHEEQTTKVNFSEVPSVPPGQALRGCGGLVSK